MTTKVRERSSVRERRFDRAHVRSDRLRVAVVAPPWYAVPPPAYGGIEAMCHALVEGLSARGHDVTLLAIEGSHTTGRFVPMFDGPQPGLGTREEVTVELGQAAIAQRILETMDVDVVHAHALSGALGAPVDAPVVVTVHGPVTPGLRLLYEHAPANVVLVSISDAQRAAAAHVPWLSTVHNGIPVADYPFQAEKDDFALFMGRMHPEKAVHVAIDAARAAGVPLVLAGKRREPIEHEYFAREIAPRLGPDVEWIGETFGERKLDLLGRARCLLFPIEWEEPFGLVMIEAMACGTPVVATRRGAVPEVVRDGETGWIVDDPSDLPAAIERASELRPERCRRHVEEGFDASVMVAAYEHSYVQAIERHRRMSALASR